MSLSFIKFKILRDNNNNEYHFFQYLSSLFIHLLLGQLLFDLLTEKFNWKKMDFLGKITYYKLNDSLFRGLKYQ